MVIPEGYYIRSLKYTPSGGGEKKKVVFKSVSKGKKDFQYRALPKTFVWEDCVSLT